jgi:hypothetical protein
VHYNEDGEKEQRFSSHLAVPSMNSHHQDGAPRPASPIIQVAAQPITWLWRHRFALGKLAMLDGDPDKGKSLVTLDLCARITTGRPFPDDSPGPEPSNVILLNAEDGAGDTVRPRLEALGADLNRAFILQGNRPGGPILGLPSDIAALDAALTQTCARLVIVDPIVAFLDPAVQIGNDGSVRRALVPLADLAERHQCAIILVRHLNKTGGHHAMYRGGGSIGFLAACRSGWLIGAMPRQPQQRVLAVIKNNLAPPQPSLKYEVLAQDGGLPTIHWLGPCAFHASQLVTANDRVLIRLQHAKDFLQLLLKDGARTVQEIWAAAEEERVSRATLKRAKKELRIVSRKIYIDKLPRTYWLLQGQKLPPDLQALWEEIDLEPWLASIRDRMPESTPIDDL